MHKARNSEVNGFSFVFLVEDSPAVAKKRCSDDLSDSAHPTSIELFLAMGLPYSPATKPFISLTFV